MQLLIDTTADSPTELYRIGKMLVDLFNTEPAILDAQAASAAAEMLESAIAPPSLSSLGAAAGVPETALFPPPPPGLPSVDGDIEVEQDDDGTVTQMTTGANVPPPDPTPPGGAPEFDKTGTPWDSRIHTAKREKKINGTWKYKRGVEPSVIVAIENELRVAVPAGTSAPLAPSAAAENLAPPPLAAAPPAPIAPVAPPPPVSTVGIVVPPAVAPANDFRSVMMTIGTATKAGKLSHDSVNAALAAVGLGPQDMQVLTENPMLLSAFSAEINKAIAA